MVSTALTKSKISNNEKDQLIHQPEYQITYHQFS
jgi:hypothetical protein